MEKQVDTREIYRMRRRRRRRKIMIRRLLCLVLFAAAIAGIGFGGRALFHSKDKQKQRDRLQKLQEVTVPDWVDVQLIHLHGSARSGVKLTEVKNIVIHYVGNPGTTAQNNRDYFDKDDTEVSSHFVIGLNGEVIQCVPLSEKSASSNWRNKDTISIEVCHPDESGKFNDASYESAVKLTAFLCREFGLDKDDVIRHYDITEKICPKYFVEHEDAWKKFKKDVEGKINESKA